MRSLPAVISLALLSLAACSGLAQATSRDEICAQRVADLCGNMLVGKCFDDQSMWEKVGNRCQGAVQTLIENENDAQQQDTETDTGSNMLSAVNLFGFSYGGVLRMGPGMEFAKQASIAEGDQVEVLADTGVWMDGYKWFKVRTPQGVGYHWGGIFCITGQQVPDGVYMNCE